MQLKCETTNMEIHDKASPNHPVDNDSLPVPSSAEAQAEKNKLSSKSKERTKRVLDVSPDLLKCFWNLAVTNEQERMTSSCKLIAYLLEVSRE